MTSSSSAPTFDVHGYSGCPLRVFHSGGWKPVLDALNDDASTITDKQQQQQRAMSQAKEFSHSRYFVEKISESPAYNARLRKQAEKQILFFDKVAAGEHEKHHHHHYASKKEEEAEHQEQQVVSTRIVIPPLLLALHGGVADRVESKCHHHLHGTKNDDDVESSSSSSSSSSSLLQSVIMPFVHHTDSLRFLCSADINRITQFEERLRLFMQWMVHESPLGSLPVPAFVSKLAELRAKCSDKSNSILTTLTLQSSSSSSSCTIGSEAVKLIDRLSAFFTSDEITSLKIPLGLCHGDLTLSNILVQESTHDRIVLIDFLDSFVETPLADMAKLNQDLSHGWTLRMLSKRDAFIDPVRLYVLFQRMMKRIVLDPFGECDWFRALFRPMCIVSQMRVMQYSKDEHVARYLWGTIEEEVALWNENK